MKKEMFLEMVAENCSALQASTNRRIRLNARLVLEYVELVKNCLPINIIGVKYGVNNLPQIDSITELVKNTLGVNNIYSFVNNAPKNIKPCKNVALIVNKATFKGCVSIPYALIKNEVLTLEIIIDLVEKGLAIKNDKLSVALVKGVR